MNNAKLAIDFVSLTDADEIIDTQPQKRQKEQELVQIVEALEHIKGSSYWRLLESSVFNGVLLALQNRLRTEKNPTEIYRLQGQIVWAEKYCDLNKLTQAYRNELTNIRKNLNE